MFVNKGDVTQLPIHDVTDEILNALGNEGRVVLCAPPGAGKTTYVPLAILQQNVCRGRIIMLEPRRLAARAAAERMAQTLDEPVGQTVGYRIRGESKVSKDTRIEVVTEGILTRMLQHDPELSGVDCVIFDEFHERSLNADLGLALCLETQSVLREDLKLLVMSATLDAEPIAKLLGDAPIIVSRGQSFPVVQKWLDRPLSKTERFENAVAQTVISAAQASEGAILVFLPGEREIHKVNAALQGKLAAGIKVLPLYGALPFSEQRAAISPLAGVRKIVLATSIAETSLTISDVRVVVDGGRARRARFDIGTGMTRLVTERVSKAEATQRQGRAGRVAEGVCYKMWAKAEEGTLPAFAPAEIETTDLTGLALELAMWGASPDDLSFLTQPPIAAFQDAQALLQSLGALDSKFKITEHGRALGKMPLHPRLGHMLSNAGPNAAILAALVGERDPLSRNAPSDITLRIEAIRDPKTFAETRPYATNRGAIERIKAEAKRLQPYCGNKADLSLSQMVALAYPDRIGQRRKGNDARFVLSGGKGAVLDNVDPLGAEPFIVATDLDGNPREAKIRQAIAISQSEIRALFDGQIVWHNSCYWSKRDRRVTARRQEQLGAIVLDDRIWKDADDEKVNSAMLDGVRDLGLHFSPAAKRFLARVKLGGSDFPDLSEATLMEQIDDWLAPYLRGITTADHWKKFDLLDALRSRLTWEQMQRLDQLAPAHFTTPLGRQIPIDYDGDHPNIELRLQELFGQTTHPCVGKTPLRVTLLSPAGRPLQTTMDIPGFWASSYTDVRKDMRGRYPKHPWPEDPTQADPTLRTKRSYPK